MASGTYAGIAGEDVTAYVFQNQLGRENKSNFRFAFMFASSVEPFQDGLYKGHLDNET